MKIDPTLYQWQQAKKSAFALAAHMDAAIGQLPDAHVKRVRWKGKTVDCDTWLGVYCYLRDWRIEQIESDKIATARARALESPPIKPLPVAKRAQCNRCQSYAETIRRTVFGEEPLCQRCAAKIPA